MFLDSIGMATSAAALFILRKRSPDVSFGWTRYTPIFATLFVAAYFAIATGVFMKDPVAAWTGTGLLGFFLLIYRVFYYKKTV